MGDDLFKKACVNNVDEGLQSVEKHKIGYPLMASLIYFYLEAKSSKIVSSGTTTTVFFF